MPIVISKRFVAFATFYMPQFVLKELYDLLGTNPRKEFTQMFRHNRWDLLLLLVILLAGCSGQTPIESVGTLETRETVTPLPTATMTPAPTSTLVPLPTSTPASGGETTAPETTSTTVTQEQTQDFAGLTFFPDNGMYFWDMEGANDKDGQWDPETFFDSEKCSGVRPYATGDPDTEMTFYVVECNLRLGLMLREDLAHLYRSVRE
ncbi:MAG: hypothetical protein ACOCXQ_01550 [Patescibacteria group bacterium]